MYPQRELTRLAAHKAALRRDVGWRRDQCVVAATRMMQPLAWLDRALAAWRRLSPFTKFAAGSAGFFLARAGSSRVKLLGSLVKWAPLVVGAVRAIKSTGTSSAPVPNGRS